MMNAVSDRHSFHVARRQIQDDKRLRLHPMQRPRVDDPGRAAAVLSHETCVWP